MINKWSLKNYKHIIIETIEVTLNEIKTHITGSKSSSILPSPGEAQALASRFAGVLPRPFLKYKPYWILWAIISRCGKAYYEKNPTELYISRDVVTRWVKEFQIPQERIKEYLIPLIDYGVLEFSDKPEYLYRVRGEFFNLIGPIAQYSTFTIPPEELTSTMMVLDGIMTIYIIAKAKRVPWLLKLPMIYTISGLEPEPGKFKIRDVLEIERVNAVDSYLVNERGLGKEFVWGIKTAAFRLMTSNRIIERVIEGRGYKLYGPWVRIHEEGARRFYIRRFRERYEKEFRRL